MQKKNNQLSDFNYSITICVVLLIKYIKSYYRNLYIRIPNNIASPVSGTIIENRSSVIFQSNWLLFVYYSRFSFTHWVEITSILSIQLGFIWDVIGLSNFFCWKFQIVFCISNVLVIYRHPCAIYLN